MNVAAKHLGHTAAAALIVCAQMAIAGQDRDNNVAGGLNVSVDLRHRVEIPQIMYFRVGSDGLGVVDKVQFDARPSVGNANNQTYSGPTTPALGDGTSIAATSNGTLPVVIMANVGTMTLSYQLSDPLGLTDGAGRYIPFDEISVISADPGGLPAPALSNAGAGGAISVSITGNSFGGRVTQRQTDWTYSYDNTQTPVAGTYNGSIQYTLSAP